MKTGRAKLFSDQLEAWLKGRQPKTLATLEKVVEGKSFAVIFLLLMILPATPLPTGGITHIFEIIVMLLSLELIVGRQTPWLPKKWKHMSLGKTFTGKVAPTIIKWVRWFERHSSPRGQGFFEAPLVPRFIGLIVLLFALGAFFSPPFSFLDTLPSLGIVAISLAIILEDFVIFVAGTAVGIIGIVLTITLGTVIAEFFKHLL